MLTLAEMEVEGTDEWGNLSWINCMDWIEWQDGSLTGHFDGERKF